MLFSYRLLPAAIFLTAPLWSQDAGALFSKAPAGVEENLRGRVEAFYDLQMAGKFRNAETYVCEDSKDRYYSSSKKRWLSHEIQVVKFEEGFKSARVSTLVAREQPSQSGPMRLTMPHSSIWKIENGEWCFHIPEPDGNGIPTPFGMMKANPGGGTLTSPGGQPVAVADVLSGVQFDRSEVVLKAGGPSTAEVVVKNGLPGSVELELSPVTVKGVTVALSSQILKRSETAKVTITFDGKSKPAVAEFEAVLLVQPLSKRMPIKVRFQ